MRASARTRKAVLLFIALCIASFVLIPGAEAQTLPAGTWYGTGEVPYQGQNPSNRQAVLTTWQNTLSGMSKWKFNTLRLPIDVPVDQSLVTQVIALARSHGMKVILDLHNDQAKYWSARYFGSQAWIDFWKAQATKWKGNPDIIAFELFNEPWFSGTWDPTYVHDARDIYVRYKACTDAIRQIDPSRTVIWGDPHCSNVLPLDAGFNGWYGHVLENYLAYKSNVVFSFHMYPAPFRCYDRVRHTTPWQEVTAAMQYVQSLGFKVWLGEFSAEDLSTGRLASNGLSFVAYCINWCVAHNSGFSLWEYRNDHGCPLGTYDKALAQSNYALYV